MTIASTPALQADLRFRGAPIAVRGAYRMLLDFEDAAGDVIARGLDGVGAVAAALGCSREEATELAAKMEEHGLARLEAARLCLLVGSRRGKRGGMSPAERVRAHRAKATTVSAVPEKSPQSATSNGTVTASGNGLVTGQASVITSDCESGNGSGAELAKADVTGTRVPPSPPPSAPGFPPSRPGPLSPPLTPPSPSDPAPLRPAGGVAAAAATGGNVGMLFADPAPAQKPARPSKPRDAGASAPLPFKIADGLAALAAAAPERFVPGQGRDITRATAIAITAQIRAYPDLREWGVCGAWLAAGALRHRGSLGLSWVASAGFREAMALSRDWNARGRPAVDGAVAGAFHGSASPSTTSTRSRRVGPAPVSAREAFERDLDEPDPLVEMLR